MVLLVQSTRILRKMADSWCGKTNLKDEAGPSFVTKAKRLSNTIVFYQNATGVIGKGSLWSKMGQFSTTGWEHTHLFCFLKNPQKGLGLWRYKWTKNLKWTCTASDFTTWVYSLPVCWTQKTLALGSGLQGRRGPREWKGYVSVGPVSLLVECQTPTQSGWRGERVKNLLAPEVQVRPCLGFTQPPVTSFPDSLFCLCDRDPTPSPQDACHSPGSSIGPTVSQSPSTGWVHLMASDLHTVVNEWEVLTGYEV